ncbi:MAG: hypothetical protein HYS12_17765 [Planctomycetes bacterium]|nr:hypothetical protein [Planctomycetota bacterium]
MSKQQNYPRGLPFRSPQSVAPAPKAVVLAPPAASTAPPRRLPLVLALYCFGFLVLGLSLGYFFVNKVAPPTEPPAGNRPQEQGPVAGQNDPPPPGIGKGDTPLAPPAPVTHNEKKEPPKSPPVQKPPVTPPPAPAAPSLSDSALEVLGVLSAAQLYQAHLNIGLLADAVEEGVYEVPEAKDLLRTIAGLLATVEKQFDRLAGEGIKEDDRKSIEQARQILGQLRTQTQQLQEYWKTNDKEHVTRFHKAREEAWRSIKTLLNLKE